MTWILTYLLLYSLAHTALFTYGLVDSDNKDARIGFTFFVIAASAAVVASIVGLVVK